MAGHQVLPPVADTLLLQFKTIAKARVDLASPQDRGEAPPDPVYGKVLAGLHLVSSYAAIPLLDALLTWRKESLKAAARAPELVVLRKRLAVETVFLEATLQLVAPESSPLSDGQANAVEILVFDWVLHAEKFVDSKHSELLKARERVTKLCAEIIGALSRTRLVAITNRFLKELDQRLRVDASSARQEILQMCEGMHYIRLSTSTDAEVSAATEFLNRMHPLRHVAPVRKSQVQHAICELLCAILKPNAADDYPRSLADELDPKALSVWFSTVMNMRSEIASWTARASKHASVGYPLVTVLLCLEDTPTFLQFVDTLVDNLHRQLKDKLLRTLILECIGLAVHAFLRRQPRVDGTASRGRTDAWLARTTKPIMVNVRKGNFQFLEQQELVREICCVVADAAPEFGIGVLITELLSVEASSWDALMIGLRALLCVLLAVPARKAGRPFVTEQEPWTRQGSYSVELLASVRQGEHPLAAYGTPNLAQPLARSLSRILINCHTLFGSYRLFNAGRTLTEAVPKERAAGLPVFAVALRCVPYIIPEHWEGSKLADELPGYTIHADPAVQQAAADVLRRSMRARPKLRNSMLLGMASFASRLPEDYPEALRAAILLLDALVHEWLEILEEGGVPSSGPGVPPPMPDLARLEGFAVCFLCSTDPDVRRSAWDLLSSVRRLHSASDGEEGSTGTVYMMDILEEAGSDIARRCYWDFGRWSDLWRAWRPLGSSREASLCLPDLLRRVLMYEDSVRWARCLAEVMKTATVMCPASPTAAYAEIVSRLQAMMYRDSSGRIVQLADASGDTWKADLTRTYAMVSCACPPPGPPPQQQPPPSLSHRELFRMILQNIRTGPDAVQQAAVLALGCCNPGCMSVLLEEMQGMNEDPSAERAKARGRPRREEVRVAVAQVHRLLADNLVPGSLRSSPADCAKFVDFVLDNLKFLNSASSEAFQDLLLLRYCLCSVARALARELAIAQPASFSTHIRRTLFFAFSSWTEEGSVPGRHRGEIAKFIAAAKGRVKDPDSARSLEAEMQETVEYLDVNAALAMAAMLLGPAFDMEAKRQQGRVFSWVDRMLRAANTGTPSSAGSALNFRSMGPSREAVGRTALLNFLSSNHDVLGVCIDQCYSRDTAVAKAYFQVLTEVYMTNEIEVQPHQLLGLILCKLGDSCQEVRDDALQLLDTLSSRVWKEGGTTVASVRPGTPLLPGQILHASPHAAVVIGALQDSFQDFQLRLTSKLARDHPELSEPLCVELMTRQLEGAGSPGSPQAQHQVLSCLAPWMQNLSFAARWEGNWSEELLRSMYMLTWQHAAAFPGETERLWCTVAANKRNVIPILDFLITRGLQEAFEPHLQDPESVLGHFTVGKRIALYMARVLPQHTIDHLVYETAQLLHEEDLDTASPLKGADRAPPKAYEFHHARSAPSRRDTSYTAAALQERATSHQRASAAHATASASGHFRRVSDLLRSARLGSDVSNHSGSFTSSINDSAMRPNSASYSPASHKGSDFLPNSIQPRTGLSRPEMAMCLLAEMAYEHNEDLREHVPLLLHVLLTIQDCPEPIVYHHAQQALLILLYSLSTRHLESALGQEGFQAQQERVGRLIKYLQAMRGQQLWMYEEVNLTRTRIPSTMALHSLVTSLVEALSFEEDLQDRWAAEALRWALHCSSRHLTERSHQVYRALRPAADGEACASLLSCLHKCLLSPSTTSLNTAVEVCLTLQVVIEGMEGGRLVFFPQLLIACLAGLCTSAVHVFSLLLDLLSQVLKLLDLNDSTVQSVLLACAPAPDEHPSFQELGEGGEAESLWELGSFLAQDEQLVTVQQLLIKGLFKPETELSTIQALTLIADQVAATPQLPSHGLVTSLTAMHGLDGRHLAQEGLSAVLGDVHAQMALSLSALLPWLCVHFRGSSHSSLAAICIAAHAGACVAIGLSSLGRSLSLLSPDTSTDVADLLLLIAPSFTNAFFPRFGRLVLERLMEALSDGGEGTQQTAALQILRAIFKAPTLDLGPPAHVLSDSQLFYPVAALLETHRSGQALQVLDAVMGYAARQRTAGAELAEVTQQPPLSWPRCINDHATEGEHAGLVLGRVVEEWQGRKLARSRIMPFMDSGSTG
ncbi:g7754 [Coccomyxa elongata]